MAAAVLKGFWHFLNTDIKELPWGELTKTAAESAKSIQEFGKAFKEQAPKIQELAPIAQQVEPFLKALDSPIVQLVGAGLPFVSIGVTLAKVYLEHSQQDPSLTDSVLLVSQIAYLASLEDLVQTSATVQQALGGTSLQQIVQHQIRQFDASTMTEPEAKKALVCFQDSQLATELNHALEEELQSGGLEQVEIRRFVDRGCLEHPSLSVSGIGGSR